jgi:hypothetical protein
MTLPNILAVIMGTYCVIYGFLGSGRFYNDIEAPLREEERRNPPKPFTKWGRISYIGFGLLMLLLGAFGKFNA